MDISHDREFKKRGSAGRQPAREQVKDTRADQRDTARDFDLCRGRDALASGEDAGRYRQDQSRNREIAAEQAADPVTDNIGMDWDAGSGEAGYAAAASQTGNTGRAHVLEESHTDGSFPADGVPANGTPVHTAARDFDLRWGRRDSAPREDSRRHRQEQSRRMHTEQADSPITDHAGMDWDAGSGGAGYEAVASQAGNTGRAHGFEAGHTDRNPPADGVPADRVPSNGMPIHTAARDFDLRRGRGDSVPREDLRRHRQNQSRRMHTEQADRKAPDMQEAEFPVHEDIPSDNGGSGISESREPEKPDMPFRGESARVGSRQRSRNRREESGHRVKQHGNKYQQRFQKEARAEEQAAASGEAQKKPSKLAFTADELPPEKKDRKLSQAEKKAERTEQKLEQAKERLPSRRKLRMETVSDPETGKVKKHLKLEKEGKTQRAHVKGPLPLRPVKAGAMQLPDTHTKKSMRRRMKT